MKRLVVSLGVLVALVFSSAASAAPLTIVSYDVTATPASGFGGWGHVYTGTITDTGRSIPGPGQPGGSTGCPCRIVDETDGTGTLADGVISTEVTSTHLFTNRVDVNGEPISPVITLHLSESSIVNQIYLYGGYIGGNIFPGAIVSATVEIGGSTVNLTTVSNGDDTLDILDLTGTGLELIPTDTVIIRDIRAEFFGFPLDQFSISEIVVDGAVVDTGGPNERLGELRAAVSALEAGAKVIRSLNGILGEAHDALEKGKSKQAAARLNEFIVAVNDYRDRGALNVDQADALIASAQAILALL